MHFWQWLDSFCFAYITVHETNQVRNSYIQPTQLGNHSTGIREFQESAPNWAIYSTESVASTWNAEVKST